MGESPLGDVGVAEMLWGRVFCQGVSFGFDLGEAFVVFGK